MESNEYIRLFTESSEDMGIMFNSYKALPQIIRDFMSLVETKIELLIKDPENNSINLNDEIAKFKSDITVKFEASAIVIGEIPKTHKMIKAFRKDLDDILDRLAKLKNRVSFGGNFVRAILLRPKVYAKNMEYDSYDNINVSIRNIDRSLDWIEKIMIDLYNMVDQDLNILTIVYRIYAKRKIYEGGDSIYSPHEDYKIHELTPNNNKDIREVIRESFNWIENFVHDEEFRENAYNTMITLENPQSLMVWMRNNIRYGWISIEDKKVHGTGDNDDENYFYKYYRLQPPTDLALNRVGVCWDQCELQRRWFGNHGIEHGVFYIELQDDECLPTHTFLVYKQHDLFWWFEHSWADMAGIHKYEDLRSLIFDVVLKHQAANNDRTSPVYVSWLEEPPKFGITCEQYMNYAHSQRQLDVNNLPTDFYETVEESVSLPMKSIHTTNDNGSERVMMVPLYQISNIPSPSFPGFQQYTIHDSDGNKAGVADVNPETGEGAGITTFDEYRGNGYMTYLLSYLIKYEGLRHVDVYTDNQPAINLYKNLGFEITKSFSTTNSVSNEEMNFYKMSIPDEAVNSIIITDAQVLTEAEEPKVEEENKPNEDAKQKDVPPPPEAPSEEPPEGPPVQEEESPEEPPPLEEPSEEKNPPEEKPDEVVEETPPEEPTQEPPKQESLPKQTDRAESDKNGVRRKKLYIAFIEWCKEYNPKNSFGSIFDKDAFKVSYPFIPDEMRYFYRLANPMLCVLAGDLTFFPVAELRKLNAKNTQMDKLLIFAATQNDLRVFNIEDKKVYRATEENGMILTAEVLGDTFDLYIQKMVNKGDILNGPLEESFFVPPVW